MKCFTLIWVASVATFALLCEGSSGPRTKRSDDPLQATVEQQAQTLAHLQAQFASMSGELANLKSRMAKQEKEVAFNVRLSETSSRSFTGNEHLVLDAVDLNTGQGYDPHTGIFTAPVSGLYVFSLHITHTPPGRLHVGVYKNEGHALAEVEASGDDMKYLDRSSNSAVAHLSAGDTVWVRRVDGTTTEIQGNYRTSFAGILVVADP